MKKLILVLIFIAALFFLFQRYKYLFFSDSSKPAVIGRIEKSGIETISEPANRPVLGIHYRMIDAQTADQNNLIEGAYITQVIQGSPAEKANLQEEDIITEIDGRKIKGLDKQSLYNLISTLEPGAQINLQIWRKNEIKNFLVTLD